MFATLQGHNCLYVLFFLEVRQNQYLLCKVFCLANWHAKHNPEQLNQPPGMDPIHKGQVFTLEAIREFGACPNSGGDLPYYACATHVSADELNCLCMQASPGHEEPLRALNNLRKKMGILREEERAQAELEM